ncbi:PDZ domain-containing protein [Alteromonas ponticola]|uniref:PDZ domain-containing protein n=1 Tax=Alteromonas aquimaris TaxID=2998417 RepID=A0ABT3P7J9_9ALTE|nr:PDZ domain-containing protein [Alteromonas aquimaris]MCW8108510.1 PDZ domain-containing protein [Alteromonas aquimaris]
MSSSVPVIEYTLAVDSISEHLFHIEMRIPPLNETLLEVSLPAWIPGSYMIRDFARHIVELNAYGKKGALLTCSKVDKQSWAIQNPSAEAIVIRYKVFAFDLSVRSAYISDEYAFCNGTSVFLNINHADSFRYQLEIDLQQLPESWHLHTSMPALMGKDKSNHFACDSYLEFIDHPIFIGQCQSASFTAGGVKFTVLFSGTNPIDIERICADLKPICLHHIELFADEPPISSYLFITLLSDKGYGGLEHLNSTALLFPRFDLPLVGEDKQNQNSYITFLSLCSHEFFHTWNVKRIKPEELIKPDLHAEVYTHQLWVYEGFTSFFDELALVRTNLISPQKYIELLAENITKVIQTTGRLKQSVAESSFDAWTRFYKQDANSSNHIVSYYVKGGLIALALDLLIREQSNNQYSLDDLMRLLWQQHGKPGVGTVNNSILLLCKREFNIDIKDFIDNVVYGTKDVPLTQLLHIAGLSLHQRTNAKDSDKDKSEIDKLTLEKELGMRVKNMECGIIVQQVTSGLAACQAGVQINDRIIALNGYEINETLFRRLMQTTTEKSLPMVIIRDGRVLNLSLPVTEAQKNNYYLKIENESIFSSWLSTSR